eukprot:SAG31_NODE_457_length_15415_cov_4.380387_19_plen_68_part_00
MEYVNEDLLQRQSTSAPGSSLPSVDLFEGSMVGLAIGDMVGLGVENFPMPICKEYTTKLRSDLKATL